MKKLITITAILFLFIPAIAFAQTAESKSSPPTIQKIAPNSYYYNYNITEVQKEPEGGGEAETFYQYNYVRLRRQSPAQSPQRSRQWLQNDPQLRHSLLI